MDFLPKIPEMAEEALTNLGANARRLLQTGTPKQQQAAQALLPAIEAELESRSLKKTAIKREAAAASAASRRKKQAVGDTR
jgi:hypothetical protein